MTWRDWVLLVVAYVGIIVVLSVIVRFFGLEGEQMVGLMLRLVV
jgi:hypothetical protein